MHNPKVAGSSPAPATSKDHEFIMVFVFNDCDVMYKTKLPGAIWGGVNARGLSHAFIHGYIGEWFVQ